MPQIIREINLVNVNLRLLKKGTSIAALFLILVVLMTSLDLSIISAKLWL